MAKKKKRGPKSTDAKESNNKKSGVKIRGQNKSSRYAVSAVVIICFAALGVFYYSHLTHQIGSLIGADDSTYVILGQSIASGKGYAHLNDPAEPPCVKYPFLFPLLLAAIIAVWGNNYYLMHLLVLLCLYLAAMLYVYWLRRWIGLWPALLLGLFVFTLFPVFAQLRLILSEFPYLLFTVSALYLFDHWAKSGPSKGAGSPAGFAYIVGLCLAAYFTRSAGLALAAALAMEIIIKPSLRKVRYARVPAWVWLVGIFGAAVLTWNIRNAVLDKQIETSGYTSQFLLKDINRLDQGPIGFTDLLKRHQTNIKEYSSSIIMNLFGFLVNVENPTQVTLIGIILGVPIFLGLMVLLRRGPPGVGLYVAAYLVILLNWPYREYDRFLCPILPFLSLCFYYGSLEGTELLEQKWPALKLGFLPAALVGVLLASQLYLMYPVEMKRAQPNWFPGQPTEVPGIGMVEKLWDWSQFSHWWQSDEYLEAMGKVRLASEYIKKQVPQDAVIICRSPEFVYLETGRHAVQYLFTKDQLKLMSQIQTKKVTHVFLISLTWQDKEFLQPVIESHSEKFQRVFTSPQSPVTIFQVR